MDLPILITFGLSYWLALTLDKS